MSKSYKVSKQKKGGREGEWGANDKKQQGA